MISFRRYKLIFWKYAYLETLILFGGFLAITYMIDPEDICLIHSVFPFTLFMIAVVTLFHGLSSGMVGVMSLGLGLKFGYAEFDSNAFITYVVFALLLGEFNYYWNRTIARHKAQSAFTKDKLTELSRAFYMLKLSHDQIEKSYITKPMSLRNAIQEIKNSYSDGTDITCYSDCLMLISKTVNMQASYLCNIDDDGHIEVVAQTHGIAPLDENDPLIRQTLLRRIPIYVNDIQDKEASEYLAVLPAVIDGDVRGMLIVKEMAFMDFNKDNLITALVMVMYIFDELYKNKILEHLDSVDEIFPDEFRFAIYHLVRLYSHYNIDSSLLVFKSSDKLQIHLLHDYTQRFTGRLETFAMISTDDHDAIVIAFPLGGKANVQGFINRLTSDYKIDDDLAYSIFWIRDLDLAVRYIKGD